METIVLKDRVRVTNSNVKITNNGITLWSTARYEGDLQEILNIVLEQHMKSFKRVSMFSLSDDDIYIELYDYTLSQYCLLLSVRGSTDNAVFNDCYVIDSNIDTLNRIYNQLKLRSSGMQETGEEIVLELSEPKKISSPGEIFTLGSTRLPPKLIETLYQLDERYGNCMYRQIGRWCRKRTSYSPAAQELFAHSKRILRSEGVIYYSIDYYVYYSSESLQATSAIVMVQVYVDSKANPDIVYQYRIECEPDR